MAFSLSPQLSPSIMVGGSGIAIKSERPVTPILTAPLSKRDRRRTALSEKLLDLTSAFAQSRDVHYRQQLQILQADMGLILNAELYHDHPLDDHGQDIIGMVENMLAVGGYTTLPANNATGGQGNHSRSDLDSSAMKGKSYAKFVEKVNDLMEERDAQMTVVAESYERGLQELKMHTHFRIRMAVEEHLILSNTLRRRLIQTIEHKRNRITREKDQLDISENNALLLHPTHYGIVNPASPSGPQSNRKTRHTRHRPADFEDMGEALSKRRRKAPAEETEAEPVMARPKPSEHRTSSPRDPRTADQAPASVYTVERLFTEKELTMNLSAAAGAATRYFANLKAQELGIETQNGHGRAGQAGEDGDATGSTTTNSPPNAEGAEMIAPVALEMDRSANASQHTTRSMRNVNNSALSILADTPGSQKNMTFGLPVPSSLMLSGMSKTGSVPPLSGIKADDIDDDLKKMDRLMKSSSGATDQDLLDQLCAPRVPLPLPNGIPLLDFGDAADVTHAVIAMSAQENTIGLGDMDGVVMSRNGGGSSRS